MIRKGKARDEIKKTSHILGMKQKCIMRHVAKGGFFNDQLCGFFRLLKDNTRQIQGRVRLSQKPLPHNVDLRWTRSLAIRQSHNKLPFPNMTCSLRIFHV
jgi:hypothetical protein